MTGIEELRDGIAAHCTKAITETVVPGLVLYRSDAAATVLVPWVYTPRLCVIAQGAKRVVLRDEVFDYDAAKYLISSVDLPVSAAVREASPARPYLALSWKLETRLLAEVCAELEPAPMPEQTPPGLAVTRAEPELLGALVRLLRLLGKPGEQTHLLPLLQKEIAYRLLTGERGAMLRQTAVDGSRTQGVMRAIAWIRRHYAEPFHRRAMVQAAGMSGPSLYRHFKAVTAMSPLQYQKQIRLGEARRLLATGAGAGDAGFSVGYESPSQFSREYRRAFGLPPNVERQRADAER